MNPLSGVARELDSTRHKSGKAEVLKLQVHHVPPMMLVGFYWEGGGERGGKPLGAQERQLYSHEDYNSEIGQYLAVTHPSGKRQGATCFCHLYFPMTLSNHRRNMFGWLIWDYRTLTFVRKFLSLVLLL